MNIYYVRQQLKTKSIYDMNLRFVYYARVSSDKEDKKILFIIKNIIMRNS